MPNKPELRKNIVIAGVVVIILALALFIAGLMIAEGKPNALLMFAFILLAGLSTTLLTLFAKTPRPSAEPPASRVTKPAVTSEASKTEEIAAENGAGDLSPVQKRSSEIISETAEELRTSVEVMQEELEDILDEDAPADKEHMESLYQETDRLRKIIDGMEQMSQAQAIARSLNKEPVPIDPLLRDIVETSRLAHPGGEISYSITCDSSLIMTCDRECLRLIIANITDNAVKAVKGTGSVTLEAMRTGGQVNFSVRDTGVGIRRTQLSHIYERFFRGTGSGVGMGLAVVKELVDACGGKIEVDTAVGRGTTVTVSLPSS